MLTEFSIHQIFEHCDLLFFAAEITHPPPPNLVYDAKCLKQHATCNHTVPCCPPNLWCDMNSKPTEKLPYGENCGTCQPHPWIAQDCDDDKSSPQKFSTTFAPDDIPTFRKKIRSKPKSCINFLSKCDPNDKTRKCCKDAPFCESGFCTQCLFQGSKCTSSSQCCKGSPHCTQGTCSTSKKSKKEETQKATTAQTTSESVETIETLSTTTEKRPKSKCAKKKLKSRSRG